MRTLFALFCFLFTGAVGATPTPHLLPPPPAPVLAAKGYVLLDYLSGQVLAAQGLHDRVEPASLTKLMTAYVTFAAIKQGRLELKQTLMVPEKAWRAEGSRMFLEPNKPAVVEDLLHGMIVQSGNDASITLAEGVAGSEEAFATLMNREAQRLGMKNTRFVNATGLPDPQHYATPYDLALLARAIIRDFPEFFKLYSIKEYRYNNTTQPNRNRLLWLDPTVDGMKTGHTEAAGFCLVATAKRQHMRLISVVVGTDSDSLRTTESQKLLNYGFQFFETVRPYQKGQVLANLPIWKGSARTLKAGLAEDLYVTVPRGQQNYVSASLESRQPLIAPVSAGQTVGTLRIALGNRPLTERPLAALEDVSVANIFVRAWHSLRLLFVK